jgi:hypothetical protein
MLLIVILNAVLAVMVVSVIVGLQAKAILADRAHNERLFGGERHRRVRTAESAPARRPAPARTAHQPITSAG